MSELKVVVHLPLPLPLPLETLIDELGKEHICAGDKLCALGEQARALVEASRQQRRKVEQALATMPITIGFSPAKPSLTDAELAEIRARHAVATPGAWHSSGGFVRSNWVSKKRGDLGTQFGDLDGEWHEENAVFAAHAHQDIPRLLAEIDRLKNPPAPAAPPAYVPPSTERPDGR